MAFTTGAPSAPRPAAMVMAWPGMRSRGSKLPRSALTMASTVGPSTPWRRRMPPSVSLRRTVTLWPSSPSATSVSGMGRVRGSVVAVRRVAAVCAPCRLDEPALPCLDADRNRDALALAFHSEQEPHLAADTHPPQVRLFLDCLADSVGVHGAHTGPAQQDGQAVATPDAEGLQFRLDLNRRGGERCLHRRGRAGRERRDQRERRNAANPTA